MGNCALFLLLGILFHFGKGAFLIAGYNTAFQKERAKIDEKKLCRYMSRMMFILAACWAIIVASNVLDRMWLLWLGLGLVAAVCIGGGIFINTGSRLHKS